MGRLLRYIGSSYGEKAIFAVLILPLVIMLAWSYAELIASDRPGNAQQALADLAAQKLRTQLDYLRDTSAAFAGRAFVRSMVSDGEWEEAVTYLNSLWNLEARAFVDRMFLSDPEGVLMADSPHLDSVIGRDFAYRDWYKGVSEKWQPYISEAYTRSAAPQYNVILAAAPIFHNLERDKVVGILGLQVQLENFLEWSSELELDLGHSIYIVDHKGHVVAHPRIKSQGAIVSLADEEYVQMALAGKSGSSKILNDENRKVVVNYAPTPEYGWAVFLESPADSPTFWVGSRGFLIAYILLIIFYAGVLWKARQNWRTLKSI